MESKKRCIDTIVNMGLLEFTHKESNDKEMDLRNNLKSERERAALEDAELRAQLSNLESKIAQLNSCIEPLIDQRLYVRGNRC